MTTAAVTAPLVLAVVLVLAAVAKIRHRGSALSSMKQLRLSSWLARPAVAAVFPWAELALAGALVLAPRGPTAVLTAACTLILMCAYWALIARGLTMTPRPTCGCFGRLGSPIRPTTLVRNSALVALAAVALVRAVAGHGTIHTLRGASPEQWWWLVAVATTAGVAALVVATERPARPRTDPTRRDPLAYERTPIPHHVLLEDDSNPVSLHELAAERAQLLVWVTAPHQRSRPAYAREDYADIARWREALPALDVRIVTCVAPADESGWLLDHAGSLLTSFGFDTAPSAVLLGADGLLAGGPVNGEQAVADFARDIKDALATAPAPGAPGGG